jgi:iron complex transport system ATP-binding protein
MLKTIDLEIGYNVSEHHKNRVGQKLNFDACDGELVALIGPNGIGKSTFLKTIARLLPKLSGTLQVNGLDQDEIEVSNYAELLSFVSTEIIRVPNFSVYQLVALGRFPYTNWIGNLTNIDKDIIDLSLRLVDLSSLQSKPINEISDGERQRAMIARALAQNTPIIVMDEPTAYLDITNKYDIVHLLGDLTLQQNKTIVFSTHDLNIAFSEADKIWMMGHGYALQGSPEDLALDGAFESLFGSRLQFDWQSGTFKKNRQNTKSVSFSGNRSLLFDLTINALSRIGFQVNENSGTKITLIEKNKNIVFVLEGLGLKKEFQNIYGLCNFLKMEKSLHL